MTGCRAAANAVELDKSREIKKAKQPLEVNAQFGK